MGNGLAARRHLPRAPGVELGPLDSAEYLEYLRIVGVPAVLLSGADPSALHTLAARLAGKTVIALTREPHSQPTG